MKPPPRADTLQRYRYRYRAVAGRRGNPRRGTEGRLTNTMPFGSFMPQLRSVRWNFGPFVTAGPHSSFPGRHGPCTHSVPRLGWVVATTVPSIIIAFVIIVSGTHRRTDALDDSSPAIARVAAILSLVGSFGPDSARRSIGKRLVPPLDVRRQSVRLAH